MMPALQLGGGGGEKNVNVEVTEHQLVSCIKSYAVLDLLNVSLLYLLLCLSMLCIHSHHTFAYYSYTFIPFHS